MIKQLVLSAAILALVAPAAARAQDGDWDDYRHQQDHAEHGGFHDDADNAHEQGHERGFYNRAEHGGYHEALRDLHGEFHEDHPGTRHDGYRLPSRRSHYRSAPDGYSPYGYSPYGYSSRGYSPRGYTPYGYGYAPYSGGSITFGFRR